MEALRFCTWRVPFPHAMGIDPSLSTMAHSIQPLNPTIDRSPTPLPCPSPPTPPPPGVAGEAESRLKVLLALTRKFNLRADVDLAAVAAACVPRLTGADLYALASDAWMSALKRRIAGGRGGRAGGQGLEGGGVGGGVGEGGSAGDGASGSLEGGGREDEGDEVVVGQDDFEAALRALQPSLSEDEVARYEAIRDGYQNVKGR
jgi:hypothetical protein